MVEMLAHKRIVIRDEPSADGVLWVSPKLTLGDRKRREIKLRVVVRTDDKNVIRNVRAVVTTAQGLKVMAFRVRRVVAEF